MRAQDLHGAKLSLALCCSSAFCSFIEVCRVRTILDNGVNCWWLGPFSLDLMLMLFRGFSRRLKQPLIPQVLDSVTQRTDRSTQAPVSVTQRTDSSTQTSVSVPQLPDSALSPTDSVRTEKGLGKLWQLQLQATNSVAHAQQSDVNFIWYWHHYWLIYAVRCLPLHL